MSESHIELDPRSVRSTHKLLLGFNAEMCLMFSMLCASFAKSFVYPTRGLPDGLISFHFYRWNLGQAFSRLSLAHS